MLINNKVKQSNSCNRGKPKDFEQKGIRCEKLVSENNKIPYNLNKKQKIEKKKRKIEEENIYEIGDTISSFIMEHFSYGKDIPTYLICEDKTGNGKYSEYEFSYGFGYKVPKEGEKYYEYYKGTGFSRMFDKKYLEYMSFSGEYKLKIIDKYKTKTGKFYYDVEILGFEEKAGDKNNFKNIIIEKGIQDTKKSIERQKALEFYKKNVKGIIVKKVSI